MHKIFTLSLLVLIIHVSQGQTYTPRNISTIDWKKLTHNFGYMHLGEKHRHNFCWKNTGSTPVHIQKVYASCSCIRISYPRHAVRPGGRGCISVSFTAHRSHYFRHYIGVKTNTRQGVSVLKINGTVIPSR